MSEDKRMERRGSLPRVLVVDDEEDIRELLDLTLARKVPLVASDFETRGQAMLSLKYKWN